MAQHAPRQVPRVLVIGAGVSGLTSALCLRRRGMDVTVVADRFAPDITSVVAGALWEWPPAVCGYHRAIDSLERSKNWCATSYRIFGELASDGDTGVFVRPVTYYFHRPVEEDPRELRKMTECAGTSTASGTPRRSSPTTGSIPPSASGTPTPTSPRWSTPTPTCTG